jgi:arsenate reductase (thioredoxin)
VSTDDPARPGGTTGPASHVVPPRRDLESLTPLSGDHRPRRSADALTERFGGVFSPETGEACVVESYGLLAVTARVTTHVPVLDERFARERLTAAAHVQGAIVSTVPEALFVCVHNAGRSQIAAALLDHHAQGRVHVRSAGSTPASEINPAVLEVMSELGLDLSREFPKPLTTDVVEGADVVITMGCGDACPVFPGKRYLDWTLPDPAGKAVDDVRLIRDDIDARVQSLLAELVPVPAN